MTPSTPEERTGRVAVADKHELFFRMVGHGAVTVVIPNASWWGTTADVLADRYRVILYDTRGRGRSDPLSDDLELGLEADVADLEALRRHVGASRVSLIGWSYLGAVVALYAAQHADVVDRVVQVGPLMPTRDPLWASWMASYSERAAALARERGHTSALTTAVQSEGVAPSDVRDGLRATILPQFGKLSAVEDVLDTVGSDLPNEHPAAIARWFDRNMAALGAWDLRPIAPRVTAPVLTVHGTEDNVPIEGSLDWVERFPNARLLRLEGVGHYPFFEQPDRFFGALSAFFGGRWPSGAEAGTSARQTS